MPGPPPDRALDLPPGERSRADSSHCEQRTEPPLLRLAAQATGGPRRCGGVDEAACGARKKSRRAEPAASGREVASVAEGTPPRARDPEGGRPPPQESPPA